MLSYTSGWDCANTAVNPVRTSLRSSFVRFARPNCQHPTAALQTGLHTRHNADWLLVVRKRTRKTLAVTPGEVAGAHRQFAGTQLHSHGFICRPSRCGLRSQTRSFAGTQLTKPLSLSCKNLPSSPDVSIKSAL